MKSFRNLFIYPMIIGLFMFMATGCSKDDDNDINNPMNGKTTAVFNSELSYGTMTDRDGNVYKTITIGTQTWMAENLRTTKYNDGTDIQNITDNDEWWEDRSEGAYCNFNNTENIDTIATYGRLYNWYAVNTGKLAPRGWHVPTHDEWTTLTDHLGGAAVASLKLREAGSTHWTIPNTGATNESGFTALPGGIRYIQGEFKNFGEMGIWWSSTKYDNSIVYCREMDYSVTEVYTNILLPNDGFSIRCVKD